MNGVALTVARSVDYLRARGHRVSVVRPAQAHGGAAQSEDVLLPGTGLPFYPGVQIGLPAIGRLRRLWHERRPQLVHVATEGPLGWSALHVARRLGIPVTTDYRTHFHRYSAHYGVGLFAGVIDGYLRRFHNRGAATFVATDALKRELEASGYRHLVTVGRGIDTQQFSPARRDARLRTAWGCASGDVAVMHVGRLAPEKNLELVVAAYAAIRLRVPRARMIWIGDGPARAALERAHPDHVFCGVMRDAALAAHYASGDLFLFPSTTETFGNVTLEALASGLAVVAYDYGAAGQHARDGIDARLVPLGDERAFIAAALDVAMSREERQRLRAAAPLAAAPLEWERVLAPFEHSLVIHALSGARHPLHVAAH